MPHERFACGTSRRRMLVREARDDADKPFLNGIDFLEIDAADQRVLHVHFVHPLPGQRGGVPAGDPLAASNFAVEGGVRISGITIQAVVATTGPVVTLRVDRAGDFSPYALRLIASLLDDVPPPGFDPVLSHVTFSFKVHCAADTDCVTRVECPPEQGSAPHLDYLAKDYASFRRLLLDRLATTLPDWRDRSPADMGIALVELLAYTGDQLSYYQDAVATEAYLGTARRRTSVRRHGRLVDYHLHDGANARAWLVFGTDVDRGTSAAPALPVGTRVTDEPRTGEAAGDVSFETLHEVTALTVSRNAIRFHTWGEERCTLRAGTTTATLAGSTASLGLSRGDVLVLEEVRGPITGRPEDADPARRHVVRLIAARDLEDPALRTPVLEVRWHERDALPFPLCLAEFDDGAGGTVASTIARANVALADHGLTILDDDAAGGLVPARVPADGRYRPALDSPALTQAAAFDALAARERPAAEATNIDPRETRPVVTLRGEGETWLPRRDLLTSSRFAPEFVVETEDGGPARLRFGDGVLGRRPAAGTTFRVRHREGNGVAGNVGAEALCALVPRVPGVTVRNPIAARGGVEPEPVRQARLHAPQAFRTQERAVTEADYAEAAQRHPDVQRAAATRRWTGSWHTMFVTIDRRGGRPVDTPFEIEIRAFLERFRMAGGDLEIDAPRFVPLDIALRLCVNQQAHRGAVQQALDAAFGAGTRADGTVGFFHPDRYTFGQPVVLSQLIATALDVPGVGSVLDVVRFQRQGESSRGEIDRGFIGMHRLEIARLDNDPSVRERGRLTFLLEGGR